ncbi:hypothetical protein [Tenacibaculum discolor]|uniref:hypothetical protein n=1 Tax=Tenacibaculum discolor TaxID=361581 RepID=UPI00191C7A6A|nr:hypothetical protein [Tenacibaculum discolor]
MIASPKPSNPSTLSAIPSPSESIPLSSTTPFPPLLGSVGSVLLSGELASP